MKTSSFDISNASRHFAADCFNRTWALLDKSGRTSAEDEAMVSLAHASLAHWRDREDCTPSNLSVGYWLASRVYATLGRASEAKHYGELSLAHAAGGPPFYVAYAHEALARAAVAAGDKSRAETHRLIAARLAGDITDANERAMLEGDLREIAC